MVIEKVHGLQATGISLNDRFTILTSSASITHAMKPRKSPSGLFSLNHNISNRVLIDNIAQRLGHQTKRRAVKQRLGLTGLRRFGSESSLLGLQRSNSFTNLNQNSIKKRVAWTHSNSNLNQSSSFGNLSHGMWRGRGFRRRGGRVGVLRGRIRGRGGRVTWQQFTGRPRGQWGKRQGMPARGRGVPSRGRGRGGSRGGITRQQKKVPTKEELDLQLDQYMASTKSALDKELDTYMKNAMELE